MTEIIIENKLDLLDKAEKLYNRDFAEKLCNILELYTQIEKNVFIPDESFIKPIKNKTNKIKHGNYKIVNHIFKIMNIGDSILLNEKIALGVRNIAKRNNIKITRRKIDENTCRLWRIE